MVGVAARGVGTSVEQRIALAHCSGGGPQARAPHMMWAGDPVCATVTQADPQLTRRCGVICTGPGRWPYCRPCLDIRTGGIALPLRQIAASGQGGPAALRSNIDAAPCSSCPIGDKLAGSVLHEARVTAGKAEVADDGPA